MGGRRKREEVLSTVGSRNMLVARKMREGIERASGCIGFRNSGHEEDSDHVNDQNRGPEGE